MKAIHRCMTHQQATRWALHYSLLMAMAWTMAASAWAQSDVAALGQPPQPEDAVVAPELILDPILSRHAYIVCGLPGDDAHRTLFAESVTAIRDTLAKRYRFAPEQIWIRFGGETPTDDSQFGSRGPATAENLAADAAELRKRIGADDELWVVVIGHTHPGAAIQFNLPGDDIDSEQFAAWFKEIECRRSVFFMTTPLSGFFAQDLSAPNRVVISATEPDLEVNETLFHSSLAAVFPTFTDDSAHDIDGDGVYTLLDLYLAVVRDVEAKYEADTLLLTEHARLDDNGDGRGAELQYRFPVAPESEDAPAPPPSTFFIEPGDDGFLAKSIDMLRLMEE